MKVLLDDWGKRVKIFATLKSGDPAIFNYKVEDLWDLMES